MANQMSADAIAELFLARLPEGKVHMRLTVKQVNWLMGAYMREALAWWYKNGSNGMPPSRREANGLWHDGAWDLSVFPNGAGVISIR